MTAQQTPDARHTPMALWQYALRFWWALAAFMAAGGFVGQTAHRVLAPPVYQAAGQFSLAVDYVSAGAITQYDEDRIVNTAGNLFSTGEVIQQVVNQAEQAGISTSAVEFNQNANLERKFNLWTITVQNANPQTAQKLAEIWMRTGENYILESYRHAVQRQLLERYIQSQMNCLEQIASAPGGQCNGNTLAEIQLNLQAAGAAWRVEKTASHNLDYILLPGVFNTPLVPRQPVANGQNQYALLGTLLGLLVGIILIELRPIRGLGTKKP